MDESQIPIDIHTSKLLDWLISRRHVSREWQNKMLEIRQKINEAIKDMPQHEGITILLTGSYINYYHCQEIIKILEKTESDSKNFFGQYGSQRMKDWKEVMRLYEKDNVYLGEVSSLLLRNVNYEIPAIRRQIQKLVQQRADYEKKEVDYERQTNSARNEINASLKELGIAGKNIRIELLEKSTELPKFNQKVAEDARKLKEAVTFYKNVVLTADPKREVMKTLQHVIEKGDTTVYEWRTGEQPTSVDEIVLDLKQFEENAEEDSIDFGEDFSIEVGSSENIDWGISTDDTPVIETKQEDSGVARGIDARSILGHTDTRTLFTNDVLELEAFLKLRQYELKAEDSVSMTMLPEALLAVDGKQLTAMLLNTQIVVNGLNNPTAINYFNINTNPAFVDQLAKKLNQKKESMEKFQAAKSFIKDQKAETLKEQKTLEPKVTLLIDRTRQLQDQIELDISHRYNGRPVNLMGGINTI